MPVDVTKYFFAPNAKSLIILHLKEFLNSRTYLAAKNNRTQIFDAEMQASLAEYQKYHRLTTQNGTFNQEVYAQIGKEMTDVQIDTIALYDPDLKKLLYGVGLTDVCGDWETVAPIIPKEKFIGWGDPSVARKNCFDYCWKQLKDVGHDLKSPGWGTKKKMNPNIYQLYLTEDVGGMKKSELAEQFTSGVLYLKKAIKSNTPVMVGVEDQSGSPNTDRVTDHYVVVVGMGTDDKGQYFLFYDNATGDRDIGTSDQNRLYCYCKDFMVKGTGVSSYAQAVEYKSYVVTQIRESK